MQRLYSIHIIDQVLDVGQLLFSLSLSLALFLHFYGQKLVQ